MSTSALLGLIALIAVAFALYLAYPIWTAISVSKQLQRSTVPYEQHPTDAQMRILVAGDSTAVGTGAEKSSDSVAGRIGAFYPSADITNVSKNGLQLRELRQKLQELPVSRYDLIVLQIGANDVIGLTPKNKITSELRVVLDYAEKNGEKVIVVTSGNIGLAPIFRWPVSTLLSYRTREVRALFIAEIAMRERVQYVDLYKEAKDDIFNNDIPRYYSRDRFHPSAEGYGVWFDDIKKLLP